LEEAIDLSGDRQILDLSHDEGPCGATGGTIKQQVARASFQHLYDKQMLTHKDFYEFSQGNINGIIVFFVSQKDITDNETELKEHFSNCAVSKN
jgi:hypothetical protein